MKKKNFVEYQEHYSEVDDMTFITRVEYLVLETPFENMPALKKLSEKVTGFYYGPPTKEGTKAFKHSRKASFGEPLQLV